MFYIMEGFAVRYRSLSDGGRQILTFLIPGNLCDIHAFLAKRMDHSIGTITPVRIASLPRERMMDVFTQRPRISAALWPISTRTIFSLAAFPTKSFVTSPSADEQRR